MGDLAYVGIADLHPEGLGATPPAQAAGAAAAAGGPAVQPGVQRRRIVVEHAIGRLRRYQALSQVDRHRRKGHTARVRAVAGLVNRMLDHQAAA